MASATALIVRPAPLIHVPDVDEDSRSLTIDSLCRQFMHFKRIQFDAGDLCRRLVDEYGAVCDRVRRHFGEQTLVASLRPADFLNYRSAMSTAWGVHTVARQLQMVRTIFKFASDSGFVDRPVLFGPGFRKPSAKLFRRARNQRGLQMFEADEIRKLLEVAPPAIKAMILLGVNCGFGNSDIGRLPFSALDLEKGWVSFPRPKTEVDRRCPLWPETIEAVKRAILIRPEPRTADVDCVFITGRGRRRWCDGQPCSTLSKTVAKLIRRADIRRPGLGFYGLRRTFETIGGESLDQIAVDFIMGHAPQNDDMAAIYRQRISDERLQVVADHIRLWLFPDEAVNYFRQFQSKAAAIHAQWELQPTMMPVEVRNAIKVLGIRQSELARGMGLNAQWVSATLLSRSKLSSYMEKRIRTFMGQLAAGKTPEPLPKEEPPRFEKPSDVPLSDEVRAALVRMPMTAAELELLARSLADCGITQVQLAAWWGLKFAFYKTVRYGKRPIPAYAADRLRVVFGLPKLLPEFRPIQWPNEPFGPGKIPMCPAVAEVFEAVFVDAKQFGIVLRYLKELGIRKPTVAAWMGMYPNEFSPLVMGKRKITAQTIARLRALFAQEGGELAK